MSQTLKEKMYEYEAMPPQGVWESIASQLDEENLASQEPLKELSDPIISLQQKKRGSLKYIWMAAAAVFIGFACFLVFRPSEVNPVAITSTETSGNQKDFAIQNKNKLSSSSGRRDAILKVPVDEDNSDKSTDEPLIANNTTSPEVGPAEKTANDNSGSEDKKADSKKSTSKTTREHTYITIAGPQGQPIKVSSKVAALMGSPEDNTNQNPAWNKKVIEWKKAMQSNTVAATPGNFLDIVELTNTLTEN